MHPVTANSSSMEYFFVMIGVALLALMFIPLYRVVRGPTVISRLLGANVIGAKTTIIIIIIGTLYGQVEMFVDIAITYAMLNFIASLAAARFLQRHKRFIGKQNTDEMDGGNEC